METTRKKKGKKEHKPKKNALKKVNYWYVLASMLCGFAACVGFTDVDAAKLSAISATLDSSPSANKGSKARNSYDLLLTGYECEFVIEKGIILDSETSDAIESLKPGTAVTVQVNSKADLHSKYNEVEIIAFSTSHPIYDRETYNRRRGEYELRIQLLMGLAAFLFAGNGLLLLDKRKNTIIIVSAIAIVLFMRIFKVGIYSP